MKIQKIIVIFNLKVIIIKIILFIYLINSIYLFHYSYMYILYFFKFIYIKNNNIFYMKIIGLTGIYFNIKDL